MANLCGKTANADYSATKLNSGQEKIQIANTAKSSLPKYYTWGYL